MIVVPKEDPAFKNLNSFYVDLRRCAEHFQGEFGGGCLHLRSGSSEAVVFFDPDGVLNGAFRQGGKEIRGKEVFATLLQMAPTQNFVIDIYRIDPEDIYFWANLPDARPLPVALGRESTDLDALLRKVSAEKLTGYVDVAIGDGRHGSLLFFTGGTAVGGSHTWCPARPFQFAQVAATLTGKVLSSGGVFRVFGIPARARDAGTDSPLPTGESALAMVRELLLAVEGSLSARGKGAEPFEALLKRKFIEKADRHPLLDPFIGEFSYKDKKVALRGTVDAKALVSGVIDCVIEVVAELGGPEPTNRVLTVWTERHAAALKAMGIFD